MLLDKKQQEFSPRYGILLSFFLIFQLPIFPFPFHNIPSSTRIRFPFYPPPSSLSRVQHFPSIFLPSGLLLGSGTESNAAMNYWKDEERNVRAVELQFMWRNAKQKTINKGAKHHTKRGNKNTGGGKYSECFQETMKTFWMLVRDLASDVNLFSLSFLFPVRVLLALLCENCVRWHRFSLNWQQVKHSWCFWFLLLAFLSFSTRSLLLLLGRSVGWPFDIYIYVYSRL